MRASRPSRRDRPRLRVVAVVAAFLVIVGGATAIAVDIGRPATSTKTAVRVDSGLDDVAVVFDVQEVDPFVVEATFRAAEQAGAAAASGLTASVGMFRLSRGGGTVHAAPDGWLIPMAYLSLPREALAGVIGDHIPPALDASSVVMNELTADLMKAQVGDYVELRAMDGSAQPFRVSAIRPYAELGGSELLMTPEASARLGITEQTRMVVWDIPSRSAFDTAVAQQGLVGRPDTKVSRSWSPRDPDDTLSTARAKVMMGEPWYRVTSDTTIEMHPTWTSTYLPSGRILLSSAIPIRARCHVGINAALGNALDAVAAAGLGGHIDVGNTNTYGGCYNPRYSRTSGFLSRHAYAMAIDMNTLGNCQGCVPRMNCDVVRIFRRHGFAWGGNFRQPDGMHFEWVGEPRDQISYPSNYCPNTGPGLTQSAGDEVVGLDVLTDGFDEASIGHT